VDRSGSDDTTPWELASDRVLVDGLRARHPEAVEEFIRRFISLASRYARWLRIPATERNHWVADLLYDVAMTLGRGSAAPPGHLASYVAGACRLRARHQLAVEASYRRRVVEALANIHGEGSEFRQDAVMELCSEYSLRDARGPDWEPPPIAPVLERLVSAIEEGVTADERRVLQWLGDQVSYTEIAKRLGITRPAAVSRIQRLRARLIEAAFRFGSGLERGERAELVRFLRRAGVVSESRVLALAHRSDYVESNTPAVAEKGEIERQVPELPEGEEAEEKPR
jgi:DNA-binding CsgD family transcriptional regulator